MSTDILLKTHDALVQVELERMSMDITTQLVMRGSVGEKKADSQSE